MNALPEGLLSFPVTPFAGDGTLDLDTFRTHLRDQIQAGPAGLFVCCGTGEFHALDPDEYTECVRVAVAESAGRVPVFTGVGYGPALARRYLRLAEDNGADGVLVLPPYLVVAPQHGLVEHYRSLAETTALPLVIYARDNAVFEPATVVELARVPNIVGFKDGVGDLDLLQRIRGALRQLDRPDFRLLNGLPTAEMTALAYWGLGVTTYSSAVHCFLPSVSHAFYRALSAGDVDTVHRYLDEFYKPLVELRRRGKGYAVSLVKAAVRLRGLDVGPVRPPLAEPSEEHLAELAELVKKGQELAG